MIKNLSSVNKLIEKGDQLEIKTQRSTLHRLR